MIYCLLKLVAHTHKIPERDEPLRYYGVRGTLGLKFEKNSKGVISAGLLKALVGPVIPASKGLVPIL